MLRIFTQPRMQKRQQFVCCLRLQCRWDATGPAPSTHSCLVFCCTLLTHKTTNIHEPNFNGHTTARARTRSAYVYTDSMDLHKYTRMSTDKHATCMDVHISIDTQVWNGMEWHEMTWWDRNGQDRYWHEMNQWEGLIEISHEMNQWEGVTWHEWMYRLTFMNEIEMKGHERNANSTLQLCGDWRTDGTARNYLQGNVH